MMKKREKFVSQTPQAAGTAAGEKAVKQDISNESYFQTVFRRFRRHHLAAVSLVVLVIIVGAALLAPVIAPYDPNAIVGPFPARRARSTGWEPIRSDVTC